MNRNSRPYVWASAALILVLALFAFPSVRAAAENFLGLFRVQQIEVLDREALVDELLDLMQRVR